MKGDCQFLSANLYARSVFGESRLALSLSLACIVFIVSDINPLRRGRSGQPEHRKRGRRRPDHGLCADTQSVAGPGAELGLAQGAEQDWHSGLRRPRATRPVAAPSRRMKLLLWTSFLIFHVVAVSRLMIYRCCCLLSTLVFVLLLFSPATFLFSFFLGFVSPRVGDIRKKVVRPCTGYDHM